MMARSTKASNQRPDTLMQDRTSPSSEKSSCNARPDHTLGLFRIRLKFLASGMFSHSRLILSVDTALIPGEAAHQCCHMERNAASILHANAPSSHIVHAAMRGRKA